MLSRGITSTVRMAGYTSLLLSNDVQKKLQNGEKSDRASEGVEVNARKDGSQARR